ncbi:C-Jun-amino-terminal kinase-interacting protein 1-like isoform X2 [Micropterus salmoides]|uniref:C-Jun-amino-terminal kinase-interacting protein 1-like isoform X2 n=1 Tax=Micropterus salmoides TaxID=27706 RepID=UPI0018ED9A09|nr:C-Jun-amino-terminal kinase-interacting protein 1-like isoform X2 [Micropterus salmoides]
MDKYRPKRPTTLALFPQLPQAGTQDSINNNSLGKKDSWKDSRSSSPHITGDLTPPGVKPKAEDKVQHSTRRPALKSPKTNGANSRANIQAAATTADIRARPRERPVSRATYTQSSSTPRSQRRGRVAGGRGVGRGVTAMRERNLGDIRGKDGVSAGKEDRRGGRLCEESKGKEKERNGHQRPREANGLKSQGADGKGKVVAKGGNRGGGLKPNNILSDQEVVLTAMVVPRTPVAPRNQDKTQDQGNGNTEMDCTKSEVEAGGRKDDNNTKVDGTNSVTEGNCVAAHTLPKSEGKAGLNFHTAKYTLVVDEHAQLELVSIKDCLHGFEHNDDSDTETVYQSANEEEDPEYEEERKRTEEARKQDRRKEEEKIRKEEETKKRREEDVKRKREEEVKRRREVVARISKQSKVTSTTTSEEDESSRGRVGASRSRKFLNLFANNSSHYSATGAGSFGVFSCVLDGVERQQSHRAVYRFVPRHADELKLETDDPVLMLNQSEDLWCQGYNMRTGATGIFPAFYAVSVAKDINQVQKDGWIEQFLVRFLGSVQVPIHKGNDVLCAAMQKVACNRRLAGQPPSACVLEVSVKGVKISVQDQCHSAHRGDQCFHFFQLKNISFCGCHPKHSKYFGFITKHPDQQRFACHVMMSETTLHPLAESVGRAFQQYYKEHIGYSCPTEDIFIE